MDGPFLFLAQRDFHLTKRAYTYTEIDVIILENAAG